MLPAVHPEFLDKIFAALAGHLVTESSLCAAELILIPQARLAIAAGLFAAQLSRMFGELVSMLAGMFAVLAKMLSAVFVSVLGIFR
jgi:hypothetical protein